MASRNGDFNTRANSMWEHVCYRPSGSIQPWPSPCPRGVTGGVDGMAPYVRMLAVKPPSAPLLTDPSNGRLDTPVDRTGVYRCGGKGQSFRKASGSRGSEKIKQGKLTPAGVESREANTSRISRCVSHPFQSDSSHPYARHPGKQDLTEVHPKEDPKYVALHTKHTPR